ncbi:30S ribosomal protein S17 [Gigaspora rosea]|uniref:Small ribosomal subunit protein uS17c n=1 Tax=Gigaspora rosea TaxID=44941 RepID=A0A397V9I8_9GLOM|nr:30S ribosomal protein S17 [Gigaspora rosea]CAG8756395.1 13161_t:CDS:2 [Gigaspora rosea]
MGRQNFFGIVVGTAMQKTVKVRVARQFVHPIVRKIITRHKKFLAHDEKEICSLGDVVRIEACRPISKRKSFTVAEIIRPARTWTDPSTGEVKR